MTPIRTAFAEMNDPSLALNGMPGESECREWAAAQFSWFHQRLPGGKAEILTKFLDANLDETRLYYGEKYAEALLQLTDLQDASYFRHGVLRRELSGDMAFDRQRDHAAHTLNNYLLGWYILCHSEKIADAMLSAFKKRMHEEPKNYTLADMFLGFGSLWVFPSLLHDVGYIFEGGLRSMDAKAAVEKAKNGADYIQDFFSTVFWGQMGLSPKALKDDCERIARITTPRISGGSLGEISDSLRDVGDLNTLWACVLTEKPGLDGRLLKLGLDETLLGDAFYLWDANYRFYGQASMAENINRTEAAHNIVLRDGLPGKGLRVLDHGVAGGMLLLLHSTLFFRLHFGLEVCERAKSVAHPALWKKFDDVKAKSKAPYFPSNWWQSVIWATGAVAIHNVVQSSELWLAANSGIERKLSLSDDPLAYLGVLVDVLQEWDRYTSSRDSIFTGKLPVSSNDVAIGDESGKIVIEFPNEEVLKKVKKDLGCLSDWTSIVEVRLKT